MNKRWLFLFLMLNAGLFTLPSCAPAKAKPKTFKGYLAFTLEGKEYQITGLPKFEDFPAENAATGNAAPDIDWSSHKQAWTFRTRLRNGLKKGANFNGHYAVILIGCGSSCQSYWIIDVTNGKVVGTIGTTLGAVYYKDSGLIATNLIGSEYLQEHIEAKTLAIQNISFYRVKNGKLIEVRSLNIYDEIENRLKQNGRPRSLR